MWCVAFEHFRVCLCLVPVVGQLDQERQAAEAMRSKYPATITKLIMAQAQQENRRARSDLLLLFRLCLCLCGGRETNDELASVLLCFKPCLNAVCGSHAVAVSVARFLLSCFLLPLCYSYFFLRAFC